MAEAEGGRVHEVETEAPSQEGGDQGMRANRDMREDRRRGGGERRGKGRGRRAADGGTYRYFPSWGGRSSPIVKCILAWI